MELFNNVLDLIELGEIKTFGRLSVIPIISRTAPGIDYRTLPEVLGGEDVRISEVDSGGSVGELSLVNDSEECLLLLDGEELVGAKLEPDSVTLGSNIFIGYNLSFQD